MAATEMEPRNPPTTILSIPAELQSGIVEYLEDEKDIIAVRQSCRDLCAASHDTFVERFFTARTYLYTKHGIQHLLDLSTQPHLVSKLRELEILAFTTSEVEDAYRNGFYPDYRPVSSRQEQMHYITVRHIVNDELNLEGTPVTTVLTQILDNLSQAGAAPRLRFPSVNGYNVHDQLAKLPGIEELPSSGRKLLERIPLAGFDQSDPELCSSNIALLEFSKASGSCTAPITSLDLPDPGFSGFLRHCELTDGMAAKSWSCLKKLSFMVGCYGISEDLIAQMARLIGFATQLDTLNISLQLASKHRSQTAVIEMVDRAAVKHGLRSITISGYSNIETPCTVLLQLLGHHRETLEELRLLEPTFPAASEFYGLADSLAAAFNFETVVLSTVSILVKDDIDDWYENLVLLVDENCGSVIELADKETNSDKLRQLRHTCQLEEEEYEYRSDGDDSYSGAYRDWDLDDQQIWMDLMTERGREYDDDIDEDDESDDGDEGDDGGQDEGDGKGETAIVEELLEPEWFW